MSDSPSTVELLERLGRLEAVLAERDGVIVELREQNAVLGRRVAELEALLRKNSHTSSKPPSSDEYGEADTLKLLDAHAALGERDRAEHNWRLSLRLYEAQHRTSEADHIRRRLDNHPVELTT